jgi:hypothetical protein
MKNIELNGAAHRAAKTTTSIISASDARIFGRWDAERQAARDAASEARRKATKTLTIEVSADIYGFLTAAGVIHNGTPEQAAAAFLEERVTDWSNADFILRD